MPFLQTSPDLPFKMIFAPKALCANISDHPPGYPMLGHTIPKHPHGSALLSSVLPWDTRMLAATTITTYPPWRKPMKQSTAGQQSAVFSKQNHE